MRIRGRKNIAFLVALAASTVLMLANFRALQMKARSQESVAAVVNVSGRQRMLSQRTALLARDLAIAEEPAEQVTLRKELAKAIALLDKSHRALTLGDFGAGLRGGLPRTVSAIYFDFPMQLDEQVKKYSRELKSLMDLPIDRLSDDNPHLHSIHSTATSGDLLRGMDAVVSAHQHDAEAKLAQLGRFIWWVSGSSFLAVALTFYLGLVTLREEVRLSVSLEDALGQARQAHDQLERRVRERTRSLAHANDELAKTNKALRAEFIERTRIEQQLRLLTESASDAIIVADDNWKIISWNQGARTIFGYDEDEVSGKPLTTLMPEDDRDAHERGFHLHRRNGESCVIGKAIERVGLRKDGSAFPLELTISTWETEEGRYYGEIVRDISERKQAESRLRVQAGALQTAANAIVITDREGCITWVNPAFTELTGYSAEDAAGHTLRLLKSGKHDESFYQHLWNTITSGRVWHGEITNRRKDGSSYHEEMTISPVRDGEDQIAHFIAIKQDITERKRAEADRAAINVARKVQESLFPSKGPTVSGFDIAGAAYPAEHVSGDYFDFVPSADRSVDVVVADVSGHGLGPSLLMAQTQAYLRTLVTQYDDPGDILTRANQLLATGGTGRFVTMFLGRFQPGTRSFVYAGAGHCGYLLHRTGEVQVLDATSMPLGVVEDQIISSAPAIWLEPGDIIVLPTDGVEEAKNPEGNMFGAKCALDVVHQNREKSAGEIVRALYQAARDFSEGGLQEDDITAAVIKVLDPQ